MEKASTNRPTGASQIFAGWALLVASCAMIVSGLLIRPRPAAESFDHARQAMYEILMPGGFVSILLAFALLSVGWIIRAISFLPERNEVRAERT